VVALTFDDGPDPVWTPAVLEALARARARATFFVVAEQLLEPGGPDLLSAILAGGHRIEAHCARHVAHDEQDRAAIQADVEKLLGALDDSLGLRPHLWRPPYGRLNDPHSIEVAEQVGLELVLWSCDPRDYRNTPWEAMLEEVKSALDEDSVILLHDSRRYAHDADSAANTVALIEPLVELVRSRGYDVGPLPVPHSRRLPPV
jgi:peptidoglycan/xylan/chitin deacetylase (PgdA/CDA1 family)